MQKVFLIGLCVLALVCTTGCEESVDAVLESDQPYTLYGFLNPRADTQAVRLFPIESTLVPTQPGELDAAVTSTDLVSGESVTWSHTVVQYDDGTYGHVVYAPFRAEYGHTYRLEVRRSDGATTVVDIPVPDVVEVERLEPYTRRFPNRVNAAPYLPVVWRADALLIQIIAEYEFEVLNVGRRTISISYDRQQTRTDGGWLVEIDLTRDYETIVSELLRSGFMNDPNAQIELNTMALRAMVINEQWDPPTGSFDPETLVEPGAWTNVENGFGFVGGGYVEQIGMFPSGCHKQLAGFYIPEGNACR